MKKILILGGKPIGSIELVEAAKERGCYVVVTDYLPRDQSPAKLIADESWNISTADVDQLEKMCYENQIDAVLTGVHEFNINRMIDLCERLRLPCYCKRSTWLYCDNKNAFKSLCLQHNIPVAKKYELTDFTQTSLQQIDYPVVIKPVDGSGSRGFSICHNEIDLRAGYQQAKKYSPTASVLIEDYIPYNAVIIHYTMSNGQCFFSGISDKYSVKFPSTGASVMGLQLFPSRGLSIYLEKLDSKVRTMFEDAGFTDGPVWVEAFYDGIDHFVFNEMGYRFGGSLTYYPVHYFYQIDQIKQIIDVALGLNFEINPLSLSVEKKYCILPIHIHPGIIAQITGIDLIKSREDDLIHEWGSAQQVFCYLHILYDNLPGLRDSIVQIMDQLRALDKNGGNLLYTLFPIDHLLNDNI